jgi:hypothetical protein
MYGHNGTALHDAQVYYRQPLSSFLGTPLYSGGTAVMGVASPMVVDANAPESAFHPQAKGYHGGHVQSIQVSPYPMPEPLNTGSVPEVTFVLVVFLLLGRLAYVWIVDAAGRVLARFGG